MGTTKDWGWVITVAGGEDAGGLLPEGAGGGGIWAAGAWYTAGYMGGGGLLINCVGLAS